MHTHAKPGPATAPAAATPARASAAPARPFGPMVQTRLRVGAPNDRFEAEAERMADLVVGPGTTGGAAASPAPPPAQPAAPAGVQRVCAACAAGAEDEYRTDIRRDSAAGAAPGARTAGSGLSQAIAAQSGRGAPMPASLRSQMEGAFGYDFGAVRFHSDSESHRLNRSLHAHAFTYGADVFFGEGSYDPSSTAGRRLVAHELTHVVQQGAAGGPAGSVQRLSLGPGEDEPYTLSMKMPAAGGGGAAISEAAATPEIQRFAIWTNGTAVNDRDLAANIAGGDFTLGFTPPTLNGSVIMSTADARAAIDHPVISHTSNVDGTVSARVANSGMNAGSYNMSLPTTPPWSTATTKATFAGVCAAVGLAAPAACAGADATTFSINGQPSDAGFKTAVDTHEQHHANDHETQFKLVVEPWGDLLMAAELTGQEFRGPTQADADALLWAAMGGTPNDIADRQHNAWIAANNAFHGTPAGATATASNPVANATCTTSSIDLS